MVTRPISPGLRKNYTWRLAENHALAEFIPETSYPSRRIIRQTDNSPADSSVSTSWRRAKFISRRNVNGFLTKFHMRGTGFYIFKIRLRIYTIICLDILRGKQETLRKYRNQSLSCGASSKKPSTFRPDINLPRLQDVLTDESASGDFCP